MFLLATTLRVAGRWRNPKAAYYLSVRLSFRGRFDLVPFRNIAASVAQKTLFSYESFF